MSAPRFVALALCGSLLLLARAFGQDPTDLPAIPVSPLVLSVQKLADGLVSPIEVLSAPGDTTGRLFIVDQTGLVQLLKKGQVLPVPFLDVKGRLVALNTAYDERGLLGLAFHPGFGDRRSPGYRKLYTFTSEPATAATDFPLAGGVTPSHQNVIAEWKVSASHPDRVDPATRREVLRYDQPQGNHNGGQLAFRPGENFLYIGTGDGGAANDSGPGHSASGNGQDRTTVLGKVLRIDPLLPALTPTVIGAVSANGQYRTPASNPFAGEMRQEIYAWGFRNPYRFSFDVAPGMNRLVAGDVGQNRIEEVDIVEAGKNYGWPLKEGTFLFNRQTGGISVDPQPHPALIDPALQYDHDEGISVLGGFVYRGADFPILNGRYLFADFSRGFAQPAGRILVGDLANGTTEEIVADSAELPGPLFFKGMGRDREGEVYLLGSARLGPDGTTGVVLKLVPRDRGIVLGAGAGAVARARLAQRDTTPQRSVLARGSNFKGGVPVATADVDGDGVPDMVTGCGPGAAPSVIVYSGATGQRLLGFHAYEASFRGGVYVAAGDVDGDGVADIVTGRGAGGPPEVKVFGVQPPFEPKGTFTAYASSFRGGVRVATGDVDGDGTAEIVTGSGPGQPAVVSVFSGTGTMLRGYNAYETTFRGGIFVSAGDVNGDGAADLVVGPGPGRPPQVKALNFSDGRALADFLAFPATANGGVHVGTAAIPGSRSVHILATRARGAGRELRFLNPLTGEVVKQITAFSTGQGAWATGRGY